MIEPQPAVIAHADWSVNPKKRRMAVAVREGNAWRAGAPEPVGEPGTLLAHLRERARDGVVLAGFDFPIGLPAAYAEKAGIGAFRPWLAALGSAPWEQFGEVCSRPDEISLHRPFYPMRPGGTGHAHLLRGLGVEAFEALLRRCERATLTRPAAECLFWTLGGKQVGKAAITGWRDLLAPALADPARDVALWPFEGTLGKLLASRKGVVAEIYPAEAYRHVGVVFGPAPGGVPGGKRNPAARTANAPALQKWAADAGVTLSPDLAAAIDGGFGPRQDGENDFDAVAGLFGMLGVMLGIRPLWEPEEPVLRQVEGWILGQDAP